MRKRKLKKSVRVFLGILLIGFISICSYFGYEHYLKGEEKRKVEEILTHYSSFVTLDKNAKIYQKLEDDYHTVGVTEESIPLSLAYDDIRNGQQTYFLVQDSNYYVYYEDVHPLENYQSTTVPEYYLPFSKSIKSSDELTFYQGEEEKFTLFDFNDIPILYADDIFYYVSYFRQIFGVKKGDVDVEEVESFEEDASYISVVEFAPLKDDCKDSSCITLEREKEILDHFKENQNYTITENEYYSWLSGNLRLKKGAMLITSAREEDKSLLDRYSYFSSAIENLSFVDNNQTIQKGIAVDSVNRYVLHQNSTDEHVTNVIQGEAIEIPQAKTTSVVRGLPSMDAIATQIAVLNYHFFYRSDLNEVCNEGNCLDVKNFRQQLDYLKANNYKTLTMEEYRAWMYGEIELPARSVLLTIDDGAMGTGTHNGNKLIPLLEEYQMHATLFLISGWWSVDYYQSPYLDIESHTYDMHQEGVCSDQTRGAKMLCSSKEAVLNDLRLSIQRTGSSTAFCFPFYAYNEEAIQSLKEVGFQLAFIGGSYKSSRDNDKYKIPRYPIHSDTSFEQFLNMIH